MNKAQQRYDWFFDNDVYVFNLLNSMYYIGAQSDVDPFYMGGEIYLELANQYLIASNKHNKAWETPAMMVDRPYAGQEFAMPTALSAGQAVVDSSAADIAAEQARADLAAEEEALHYIYVGDVLQFNNAPEFNWYTVTKIDGFMSHR